MTWLRATRVSWIALALIAILLVAVVFAPIPGDTRWIRTLHNSAHAPIFGCVAVLTIVIVRAHPRFSASRPGGQYGFAVAAVFGLGILTELLQIPVGRDASFEDVLHDVIGAVAFLGIFAVFDSGLRTVARKSVVRLAAGLIGSVALAIAAAPVTRAALKYHKRDELFPVLADFSHDYDRYFIFQQSSEFSSARLPEPWARSAGESALRARLLDGPYAGLNFIEVPPDWSGYGTLAVDLTNPTSLDLQLVIRVHDAIHDNQPDDRFSRRVELPAGSRQVFRIPLAEVAAGPRRRALDLRQVAGLIIFRADDSPRAGEMFLSRVWLE